MSLFPRKPLLGGALLLCLIGLASLWYAPLSWLWQLALVVLLATALADRWLLRRLAPPQVQRQVHHSLAQGSADRVRLELHNTGQLPLQLQLHDHHPSSFRVAGLPAALDLPGGRTWTLDYPITPTERGDHAFGAVDLVLGSPLGLWSRRVRIALAQQVRVYPNFGELSHYALLARRNRLAASGIRRHQRRGSGNEFHQLRDYRQGDALRQIEWKATGRYRRLISRDYQDEQNQQLFFLLDCGQRMRHRDDTGSHMDSALNAMLLAAHVAARQGDAVGYMTFAGSDRYLPPRKGAASVTGLLHSAYDIESSTRAADYPRVAERFMAHHLQRALLVLITNTRAGDQDDLLGAARLLQTRHLLIVADLREQRLDQALQQTLTSHRQALRYHTVQALRQGRAEMHERLRHQGVLALDLLPAQLPLALVNEYFEVKRSARL